MSKLVKLSILVLFVSLFVGFTGSAKAYYPTLNVSPDGTGNVTVTISGGQPNAAVVITFTPPGSSLPTNIDGTTDYSGNFTTVFSTGGYNTNIASQITATVGGQQAYLNGGYGGYNGGCGYYGCTNVGGMTLSQTSLTLSVGQSTSVTASFPYPVYGYTNNIYISSNSNSSVASASVSGNQVTVYGIASGSTSISVCQNSGSSACASLYVTVGGGTNCYTYGSYNCGSNGSVWFNPTSPSMYVGQSLAVSINSNSYSTAYPYNSTAYYISSNSNSGVVTATVSGTVLNLYANQSGSSSISVCSSALGDCGTLYVTVSGGNNCGYYGCSVGGLVVSPSSLSLTVGQSATASVSVGSYYYSGGYYISSNSNSGIASASISGSQVTVYGIASGSTTLSVCQNSGSSACASLYVTVTGVLGANTNLWFSPGNPNLYVGQSLAVSINSSAYSGAYPYNSGAYYYISSNSNSGVVTATVSGTVLNLYANQSGSSSIIVCNSSLGFCGTIYVTVGGSSNYGGSLSLSQSSVALNVNQTASVAVYGNGSYYISSNSNSSVASAYISGSSVNITGLVAGSNTISICQTNPSYQCGTLYVTVNGYNSGNGYGTGSLWFNPASVSLNVGQSLPVSINSNIGYGTGYYISSNSNSYVASASLSGSQLNIYGLTAGTTTITVCQSNGGCGSLYATVGGSNYSNGNIVLSQYTLGLNVGQSATVNVSGNGGYGYYISSNGNPGAVSANFNGSVITVYGITNGSSTLQICQNSASSCVSLYVTVGGGYAYAGGYSSSGGGLAFPGGSGSGGGVLGVSSYPNGTLISVGSTVYIVYKGTQTPFADAFAFTGLGFSFNNVLAVGSSGLAASGYIVSTPYARHPWGSWIKSGSTIYFVSDQGLIPIPDWATFLNNGGQAALVVPANTYDFKLAILSPMVAGDPRLQ